MNSLLTVSETNKLIAEGRNLMIAGDESVLGQLQKGNWIGGTIPYFMTPDGGMTSKEFLQVTVLAANTSLSSIRLYNAASASQIPSDYAENGFSLIIIPAFSDVHQVFAKQGSSWPSLFTRPLVGWVSGFHLDDAAIAVPKVFNGQSGEVSSTDSVVMHLDLPSQEFAKVNIINIFEAGAGDVITFPKTGFEVGDCFINGKSMNFAEYIQKNQIDLQLPLVADYLGAMINVSFQLVDEKQKIVQLYAPVFEGVEYRVAKPVGDYETAFAEQSRLHDGKSEFMCNCVLNFMYGKLESKKIGKMLGPMTFGEIAYMLLNQTLVYLTIETRS